MGSRSASAFVVLALVTAMGVGSACHEEPAAIHSAIEGDAGTDAAASLCVDGRPMAAYPPGPYELGVLGTVPAGLAFVGTDGPVALQDFFEPCAERSRLLVVRSSAAWCGPCLWHAAHTTRFMDAPKLAGRVVLVDLLIADEENMPAEVASLARWRTKIDAPGSKLAIDPRYTFGPALLARSPLPEYVIIDTRTMKILAAMSDPDPVSLVSRLEIELAELDHAPRPEPVSPPLFDGHFTENEIDLIRGMKLGELAPPPDPTNEYADVPEAAALGKALFSDPLLSPSKKVSCATCHDPGLGLSDGAAQSTGVAKVDRNSPAIALSAHSPWQFWDGRADTLWMQALGPFEDEKEFGGSRLFVAQQIVQRYSTEYAAVFESKYPLPDLSDVPAEGKPGDPAYDALPAATRDQITRVFVNVGKAIAAFERAMRVKPNALDKYADGDLTALSPEQKHSLAMYMKNGCVQCHWGPRLTDDAFHVLRFPTGRQDGQADTGRKDGLLKLADSEFRASSKWSDAPSLAKTLHVEALTMLGAFKTPTLRGLPATAPYGHGGTLNTLFDVAKHYGQRGLEHAVPQAVGTTEQWVPNFDATVVEDLPAILEVLTGEVVVP
ncbi:MAG TPA: cytochrome c peroxidase [Labilithrix sp.]|nr:cytochrome c peroxidase [Labilithrix sp.]